MSQAKVYHSAFGDGFKHVANVDSDSLEEVYRLTNSIEHHWAENDAVEALTEPTRSTSVDDFVCLDSVWYVIAGMGFEEVHPDTEFELMCYNDDHSDRFFKTVTINELLNANLDS